MNSDAERWRRAGDLFDRALDLEGDARRRFLDAACGGDALLRARVERLLQADAEATHLDRGVDAIAGAVLRGGDAGARIGERFGPYRIERTIGHGGMGEVYLARREDADFEQHVALKLMRSGAGGDEARRRFLVERRLLAKLEHPNIARLYDGGFGDDAQPWYAMEYVDGAPLTAYCDDACMPLKARLRLFAKVCEAIDHAHRHLIVHRDLKPANVLVDARGEPRLLDFGIAKLLVSADADSGAETALMTPEYAAPEQLRGEAVSIATDVYALGAVLFELLTGRRPFADALASREPPLASRACADGTPDLSARVEARALRSPDALRRALRGDLDRVLLAALDPVPERRYRSASRLAEDLRAVADGRPISLRGDRRYRFGKFVRRHRWAVAAASVAVVALLATSTVALLQAQRAQQRARTALAVKDFVVHLLQASSPEVALGRTPTVREVLDLGRAQLPRSLAGEPEVAVELLTLMARNYVALNEYATARELLARAQALAPRVDPERRAALLEARLELALHAGAEAEGRDVAAALQAELPRLRSPRHRVSATLALADYEAEDLDRSAALAQEALRDAEAHLPPGDMYRIRALRVLADSKDAEGATADALRLQERAYALAIRHLPRLHPETVLLRGDLIDGELVNGRHEDAIALARRALADDIAVYGAQSYQAASSTNTVGGTLLRSGRYVESMPSLSRALRIYAASQAPAIEEIAACEYMLARAHEGLGALPAAQRAYQHAYDHYAGTGRETHSLPYLHLAIARVMAKRGDAASARGIYEDIARSARRGSSAHGQALTGLGNLARTRGAPDDALALHQRAVAILAGPKASAFRNMQHPLLSARLELARDQQRLGLAEQARATLVSVVRALDTEFPYEAPDLARAYPELAALTSSPEEARRLLARGLALHERMFGTGDPRTVAARQALAARTRG